MSGSHSLKRGHGRAFPAFQINSTEAQKLGRDQADPSCAKTLFKRCCIHLIFVNPSKLRIGHFILLACFRDHVFPLHRLSERAGSSEEAFRQELRK